MPILQYRNAVFPYERPGNLCDTAGIAMPAMRLLPHPSAMRSLKMRNACNTPHYRHCPAWVLPSLCRKARPGPGSLPCSSLGGGHLGERRRDFVSTQTALGFESRGTAPRRPCLARDTRQSGHDIPAAKLPSQIDADLPGLAAHTREKPPAVGGTEPWPPDQSCAASAASCAATASPYNPSRGRVGGRLFVHCGPAGGPSGFT